MIKELRAQYNQQYSSENYKALKGRIQSDYPDWLQFRISESPIFVDDNFLSKVKQATNDIVEQIKSDKILTIDARIPKNRLVPNESKHPNFLSIDFGICENEQGEIEPQLIEMQAFPSLFFYQLYFVKQFQIQYPFLKERPFLFNNLTEKDYLEILKDVLIADENPENVILLEIFPDEQKTKIDFILTKEYLGIETVCFTKIKKKGNQIFYEKDGKDIQIKRIFNRFIFDDLDNYPNVKTEFKVTDDVDVQWITHPNWFYKISKIITPYLAHQYIPKTYFVDEFPASELDNLDKYVLKPLFSYAGQGVNMHPKKEDLEEITKPKDYILQKKVKYAPIFEDVNGEKAKAEFRVLCTWKAGDENPKPLISLVRMTKSEMVNVDQNKKEQIWTGSSVAFF